MSKNDQQLTPELLELLDEPIQILGLDVRTLNALEDGKHEPVVRTIRDLLSCTPEQLLQKPNVGEKTVENLYLLLEGVGFFRESRQIQRQIQQELDERKKRERRYVIGF